MAVRLYFLLILICVTLRVGDTEHQFEGFLSLNDIFWRNV